MRTIPVAVAVLSIACWASASDLRLKVSVQPEHAVLAEPIEVVITLESQGAFTLPQAFGLSDGGHTRLVILDTAGRPAAVETPVPPSPKVLPPPCDSIKKYPAYNGLATARFPFNLPAGTYLIHAEYESAGQYYDRDCGSNRRLVPEVWVGKLISTVAALTISPPQGEDAAALRALIGNANNAATMHQTAFLLTEHASDFLERFPTSTYAAYVVRHLSGAEGMGRSDPARVIADRSKDWGRTPLEVINLLEMISVPYDVIDGKKIGGEIHGMVAIAWREKWFRIVLKAHPDIWFANELKLRTAMDQLTLKNYQAAQAELEAIAKDEKTPMAPKAKEYLGLMKQKGWIKN